MTEAKRVLIVDDESKVLLVLSKALKLMDKSFEVVTARSGRRALQKIKQEPFDLLITDLRMSGVDGLELTEAVRSGDANTVVVWITAYGCHRLHEEGKRLGVFCCIDKPLKIGELRRVTLEALEGHSPL